jgi:sulfite reductase beta subunit-like hemoprotein
MSNLDSNYWASILGGAGWPEGDPRQLRRLGVYAQRPSKSGYFMIRVRVAEGTLAAAQLAALGDIANNYGRGIADVTVRQNIQIHWIPAADLPEVLARVYSSGLATTEPCSSLRNVVTCPVSGIDQDELFDAGPLVRELNARFASKELSGLPRKLKVTITGCPLRCTYPEVNDIGLFSVPDFEQGGVAFRARVGGGLSGQPRFSRDLGILIRPGDVVDVVSAIALVFRARSLQNKSALQRVNYLVPENEIPDFREAVEAILGRPLRVARDAVAQPVVERDRSHCGIGGQNVSGLYYIGTSLPGGRTSGDELIRLSELSVRFGAGRLRTTPTQNIVLTDLPECNLQNVADELDKSGIEFQPGWARRAMIACSGTEFCNMALAETKGRADSLAEHLEQRIAGIDDAIRISVTGCPNSCGQHQICDVGLEGTLVTIGGVRREAFHLLLGGGVGRLETVSRRLGLQIEAGELPDALGNLFRHYSLERGRDETFQEFCARHSDDELVAFVLEPGGEIQPDETDTQHSSTFSPSQPQELATPPNSLLVPGTLRAVECPL